MKKSHFNIALEMPLWLVRIMVLILILVVVTLGISAFLSRTIEVKKFESQLVMYNVYNCLSKNNIGVIDSTKIDNLEKCMDFGNLELGLNFTDLDGNLVKEKYLNKEKFLADINLCNIKIENERFSCYSNKDYLIMDDKPVILEFNLIYPDIFGHNEGLIK